MNVDALEIAIKSADINCPGQMWDEDKLGVKKDEHRHAACPRCGFSGLASVTVNGLAKVRCDRCETILDRVSYRKPSGPNQAESRAKRLRDLGDGFLPDLKGLRRLSKPARLWLEWSHTSLCSSNKEKATQVFMELRWYVYMAVAELVTLTKRDDPKTIFVQLFALCEAVINGARQGHKMPSMRDLGVAIGIDHSQFAQGRRWGQVVDNICQLIASWEQEVVDQMGAEA